MTVKSLLDTLRLARDHVTDPDVLREIDNQLLAPHGYSIALPSKGDGLAVELPSGTHVNIPPTAEAMAALQRWLSTYGEAAAQARRTAPTLAEAQAKFFGDLLVGSKAAPIQYVVDKQVKRYDAKGKEILPAFTLDDLDEETESPA